MYLAIFRQLGALDYNIDPVSTVYLATVVWNRNLTSVAEEWNKNPFLNWPSETWVIVIAHWVSNIHHTIYEVGGGFAMAMNLLLSNSIFGEEKGSEKKGGRLGVRLQS